MQNLTNKINGFLNAAISTTVLMVCVGSFLALFPTLSLEITRWIFIIALVSSGISIISADLVGKRQTGLLSGTVFGSFIILLGLIILTLIKICMTLALREISNSAFTASILMNLISVVSGCVIIFQPITSTAVAIMIVGIMLVVYGVSDLINVFILKKHVKDFAKNMKAAKRYLTEDIKEAEIVEDKKKK